MIGYCKANKNSVDCSLMPMQYTIIYAVADKCSPHLLISCKNGSLNTNKSCARRGHTWLFICSVHVALCTLQKIMLIPPGPAPMMQYWLEVAGPPFPSTVQQRNAKGSKITNVLSLAIVKPRQYCVHSTGVREADREIPYLTS